MRINEMNYGGDAQVRFGEACDQNINGINLEQFDWFSDRKTACTNEYNPNEGGRIKNAGFSRKHNQKLSPLLDGKRPI